MLETDTSHLKLQTLKAVRNYVRQFFKIRVVFYRLYLWNEVGDPHFFCISDTNNSLSVLSKNFRKIYRLENFRANVLKGVSERKKLPISVP